MNPLYKRNCESENFSPSKRQRIGRIPLAETGRNTFNSSEPLNPFPAMTIQKPSGRRRIHWLSKHEVETRVQNGSFQSFNERWLRLHSLMQGATTRSENSIFIDFDEDLCIRLQQKEAEAYHSEALGEKMLRDFPSRPNPYHRYVKVKECFDGKEVTLIKITYSPLGKNSELCWIEKGTTASGNKLFEVHEWIQNLLKPGKVFLFDDANLTFKHGSKKMELSLRYLKVFTSAVAPFKSWYEERGYELYEGGKIDFNNGKDTAVFNQNQNNYLKAKHYLRNVTLMRLGTVILVDRMNTSTMVQKLFQRFVQKENPTMGDLIQALAQKSKQAETNSGSLLLNIHKVFSDCLTEWECGNLSAEVKTYLDHVTTLRLSRVYVKRFQDVE